MRKLAVLAAIALAAVAATIPGAFAAHAADGITKRTITLGATFPLSGPVSFYAPIATGMRAYFSYINARRAKDGTRGVYGRQIVFKVADDQYNPAQTVQLTRRLVESDKVFAIVASLGTEQNTAIRDYLNQRKVPHLYVSTGATKWGAEHSKFPWTIGWQPDYQSEGNAYGRYIRTQRPNAKIAILYQNDDYGRDYLRGFRQGLGSATNLIVAEEPYEVTETSVAPRVAKLRGSGADTFLILAVPGQTIQALVTAHRLGWKPLLVVNSVSATDFFLATAQRSAGSAEAVNGVVTTAYLKDATSPQYANDPTVQLYKRLMAKYAPGANAANQLYFYGMAKAETFVQALYRAGKNPTRESLRRAAENLTYKSPWVLPGSQIATSTRSAFPISIVKLTRYENGAFTEFGALIKTR